LQPGDLAPNFEALDHQGQFRRLSDHLGKRHVVVFFYPGDFTQGCIKQAEDFRDRMNLLAEKGVLVIGVSGDTVPTHHLFHRLYHLNFTLLADNAGAVATQFGVPFRPGGKARAKAPDGRPFYLNDKRKSIIVQRGVTAERWTFLLDPEGRVLDVQANVDPTKETNRLIELLDRRHGHSSDGLPPAKSAER
jgi:peroxiredoxin Q/BCP